MENTVMQKVWCQSNRITSLEALCMTLFSTDFCKASLLYNQYWCYFTLLVFPAPLLFALHFYLTRPVSASICLPYCICTVVLVSWSFTDEGIHRLLKCLTEHVMSASVCRLNLWCFQSDWALLPSAKFPKSEIYLKVCSTWHWSL